MPTVEDVLAGCLIGGAGLSGVKVRPQVAKREDVAPYIIYTQYAGTRVQSLKGDSGLANPRFQVDVYAAKKSQATELRIAAHAAIMACGALGAVLIDYASGYEPDTKLFRERQDFSFWFND